MGGGLVVIVVVLVVLVVLSNEGESELIKFVINTSIVLSFVRYKSKTTFI